MPAAQAAVVVADCVEVVDGLFAAGDVIGFVVLGRDEDLFLGCFCGVGGERSVVDEEGRHVECLWEKNSRFVFLLAVGSLVFEPLQVQDQDLRCLVYLYHFFGQFVLLAAGTVPLVAPLELFLLAEVHEAVLELHRRSVVLVVALAPHCAGVFVVLQVLHLEVAQAGLAEAHVQLALPALDVFPQLLDRCLVKDLHFRGVAMLDAGVVPVDLALVPQEQAERPLLEH